MTAPDPGLTDLIAAHEPGDRWTEFMYPPAFSDKPFVATSVTKMVNCSCGEAMTSESHPAHVALTVEQHTNGRTTELEAAIARVREFADNAQGWFDSHQQRPVADAVEVLIDYLRAALEGEQQ